MRLSLALGMLILAATLGAPAAVAKVPPGVDGGNKCIRLAERNAALKVTRDGVVFHKETGDPSRFIYGCLFRTERAHVLTHAGFGEFAMNGRYVAYYTYATEDYFDYLTGIEVTDLETGRAVSRAAPAGPEPWGQCVDHVGAGHIALRPDGAVAWTAARVSAARCGSQPTIWQVSAIAAPGGDVTTLDSGSDIDPESIAESSDGTSVTWTRGGQTRSARLGQPRTQPVKPANRCFEAAERSDAVRLTRHGVIIREHTPGEIGALSGCLFGTERVYELRNAGLLDPAFEGRYSAYFTKDGGPNDNDADELRLTDLRTGRVVTRVAAVLRVRHDPSCKRVFRAGFDIVLRADGAVAWISGLGDDCRGKPDLRRVNEVSTAPAPGGRGRAVDAGAGIDPRSLAKSRDGRRITWTKDGKRRSARLGR